MAVTFIHHFYDLPARMIPLGQRIGDILIGFPGSGAIAIEQFLVALAATAFKCSGNACNLG